MSRRQGSPLADGTPLDETPVVSRIAGLPAAALEAFGSDLGEQVRSWSPLEAALSEARTDLVNRLYEAIPEASPESRSFLLQIKRDAYNGRGLEGRRASCQWGALEAAAGLETRRVLGLEQDLARLRRDFERSHQRQLEKEGQSLVDLLADPLLRCGLAVASPEVTRLSRNLHRGRKLSHKKRKRLELTLLRYVSRAVLKLSPFSTFTPVALGTVVSGAGSPEALELLAEGWQERSLVRLKRYVLDELVALLDRHPPFREGLEVALNDTALELSPRHFLFLRPSFWKPDPEKGKLIYHREALIKTNLRGPLIAKLRLLLSGPPLTYGELIPTLAEQLHKSGADGCGTGPDITEAVRSQVDRLLEIGFLQLLHPWPTEAGYLEKRLLDHLRSLAPDTGLEGFSELLGRLVELQESCLEAESPEGIFSRIRGLVGELWRQAAPFAGLPRESDLSQASIYNVYQDVFRRPHGTEPGAPALRIDRSAAEEALASVEPLVRAAYFFDHRRELLHTLEAFLAERWPDASEVPLLQVFEAFQPPWQEFVKFQVREKGAGSWLRCWNPMERPEIAALEVHRRELWQDLEGCWEDSEECRRISVEGLHELLDRVPAVYTSAIGGACLFLQPAVPDGSLWMLNRIKEGTGRFSSRYTPVMDPAARQRFVDRMTAHGTLELNGEHVELLDLQCIQGDTLNVHEPQTPKTLTLPGARTAAAEERQLTLGDLVIRRGDGQPQLRDRSGQRYLPVHLGVGYQDFMPTLIRFLCVFGPSEMAAVFPPPRQVRKDGTVQLQRTVIGNVVLARQSWIVDPEPLRRRLEGRKGPQIFEAVDRWRRRSGIPRQVFAAENVPHAIVGNRAQPQYLDFSSPLFVEIFQSILKAAGRSLTLVEALPSPEQFPQDRSGRRWAVEVLLESLVLPHQESHDGRGAVVQTTARDWITTGLGAQSSSPTEGGSTHA